MAPSAALHRSKMKPERLPLSLGVAGLLVLSIVPPAGAQGKPDSADRFPPKFRRLGGAVGAGVVLVVYGIMPAFLTGSYDFNAAGYALFTAVAAAPGFSIGSHFSKMGTVYKVPPKDGAAADGQQ